MELFTEQSMFDHAGVSQASGSTNVEHVLEELMKSKRYAASKVTTVTLESSDFDDTGYYNTRGKYKRTFLFTPKEGYEERRATLADMFPFALVVSSTNPMLGLKADVLKQLSTLFHMNYVIVPFRVDRRFDDIRVSVWKPGRWRRREMTGADEHTAIIDMFSGGKIATDSLKDLVPPWAENTLSFYRFACRHENRPLVDAYNAYAAELNTVSEVLA